MRSSEEREPSDHSTSRAKGLKKDKAGSAGSGRPCPVPCRTPLLQGQPGRLESQVLGQEHGEDAAQVVDCGWVQVGLRVLGRVPDRGEGRGDEVEHRDPWRAERRLGQVGPRPTQEPRPRPALPRRKHFVLALEEL